MAASRSTHPLAGLRIGVIGKGGSGKSTLVSPSEGGGEHMTQNERRHELGSGGECICPRCEARVPHQRGVHCADEHCPLCGSRMLRVGSRHHELWLAKHRPPGWSEEEVHA